MNCHDNCNQGRNCDGNCNYEPPTVAEVFMAGLFGLAIGGILALTYVYRTGGF